MTPEQFQQAQQLFLDAIELPEARRPEYVEDHAENDSIRREVLSLLQHHGQETLIRSPEVGTKRVTPPPVEMDTLSNPEGRAEFLPTAIPTEVASSGPRGVSISPRPEESSRGDIQRFFSSTNRLLQQRLKAATVLLGGILVFVSVVIFFLRMEGMIAKADPDAGLRLAVRILTLYALILCGLFLHFRPNLPRRILRRLEIVVIAIPLIQLALIQWFESTEHLLANRYDEVEELRAIAYTAASIYIAVYGIFIPSNWRRTAVVTGLIAMMPLTISLLHQEAYEYPKQIERIHFLNPLLATVMAIVATTGAGIVHRVRREAERAKHYGQYELIEEIGRGGMGVVYLGKHQMLKRPAAIKLINSEAAGSPQAISQFEKEVQATATLSHWNTVQIYDYGITDEGDFYCVMEYLKGMTLQQRLARDRKLQPEACLKIVIQLCNALDEAHRKGLVHRDIKPANVFLAEVGGISDVVKLLDFGLVVTAHDRLSDDQPPAGGTPAYMSPEQIRGERVDGRSDIYALGCLMYECLAGRPPFRTHPVTKLLSDQMFKLPEMDPIVTVDEHLPPLLQMCLAKEPGARFHDVVELRHACEQVLEEIG